MSMVKVVEATLSPSGETQILPPDEKHLKSYVYVGGAVYPLKSVEVRPSAMAPVRPSRILFGAINHPRLRMKTPIPVDISAEGESVVASCSELEEFGYGPSLSEALDDFGRTVCQLYFSLDSEGDRLNENLKEIRSRLSRYLEPRRARE